MWSFLEFWRARTTLWWGAHFWDNSSRWTLSYPNFNLVPGAVGEFDGVFWSQSTLFTQNRLSRIRILRYTTQLCRLLQWCNWSFRTTFLWLFAGLFLCLKMLKSAFIAMCASGFRPVIQTHGKMPKFTWRILTEFESTWNFALVQRAFLFTAWSLSRFLPLAVRLFCLRMGCRRRRSSFFVSDHCHCCQRLSCHDWEYMSLLWNIIHVPSTENTFPLSSQRRLSFLFDAWSPFHNIVPDPEVSSSHHLVNMKFYSCFQLLIVRLLIFRRFLIIQSQHSLKLNRIL